jgi:uncharacterized repeat protein (TIGR03803 family)
VRQEVLTATLARPDKWWYLSELADFLHTRPSSLQRELAALVESGILERRRDGRRTYFKAETRSPIYRDLRSIFEKTVGLIPTLGIALRPFESTVACAFVYGSMAGRSERATSDVDLMVIGSVGLAELSPSLRKAEKRLGREINVTNYSVEEFRKKVAQGDHFLTTVLKGGLEFVKGEHESLKLAGGSLWENLARPFATRLRALSMALALTIVLLPALAAAPAATGRTYKVLYNFTGGSDGGEPYYGSLVQDKAGNLYGTTTYAGAYGYGAVFKLTQSGTETVLYSFNGEADGAYPYAGLVLSGDTLYGTTAYGGSAEGDFGCGVVFEVNIKTGAETVLYTLTGGTDGAVPVAALVQDRRGNLYGTTLVSGSPGCDGYGCGTVFEVVPKTKKEIVLHSFDNSDGANPGGLTLDTTEKVLFGKASGGGPSAAGVVFSLTIKTRTYTVLYNFTGSSDGGYPWGTLALDPKGNVYGSTVLGGDADCNAPYGCGTVFRVVPKTKKEAVLYSFTGDPDGANPYGGVIRGKNGNVYCTTSSGGFSSHGTVFELVKGTGTVLHTFDYSDGAYPLGGLIEDSKGNLYGTANEGGSGYEGVVWEITP